MDMLIALAALILFDVAAWFWGVDSRVMVEDERAVNRPPRRSI